MKKIQVAAAVALALSSVSFAQQAVQWKVSDGGNGHWYTVVPQELSWTQARSAAETMGAHLVTITSSGENSFVGTLAPLVGSSVFGAWAGGYQTDNSCGAACSWTWVTGEAWGYANWWVGEPNDVSGIESSLEIFVYQAANYWSDAPDSQAYLRRFAVEWDADCNGDGIVDYGQCRDGSLPDYNGNNIPDCCEAGTPCVVGNYPVQWRVADGGNGHWYDQHVWTGPATALQINGWLVANKGAHMVTLNAASEDAFVYERLNLRPADSLPPAYSILGGYQDTSAPSYSEPSGGWRWVTGEPMQYTNWGPGLPDNVAPGESVLQYPGAAIWNDAETSIVPAGHRFRVIIEWSADCNNDGIVDKGQILRGQLADLNMNGIPDTCEMQPTCQDADLLADRNINGADLGILLSQWGPNTQYTISDINSDGVVDGSDLGLLLSFWGPCPY